MKSKRKGTGERIEREKKYGKTSREWIKEKERWVKKTHQRFLSQNACLLYTSDAADDWLVV